MAAQQTNLTTDLTQLANNIALEGFSFQGIVNNFHFIRPWWLLAFFALFLVIFLLKKIRYYQSPWQHFLPNHLASALLENSHSQAAKTASASSKTRYWLKPLVIGSCIIFALAGPAWQKLPQPVYQLERGAVLIMDMSYSMYATDVKPNRLTRARYKAIDLLKKINEGDVGLIAYAGDAFIISPLTQDVKNIELLLPSLSPDIMPVHGANALSALTLADQTLKNAGHISGDIYWFTDDIDNEEMSDVYDWANDNNHKVNILGVGSTTGAPIKLSSGKLLKDNRGAIVIPKLPESRLSAIAQRSRGVYHTMANDDADIKALTAHLSASLDDTLDSQTSNNSAEQESKQAMQGDQYQEQGPWLLLIILPFILSYFRRGSSILAISWLMPLTLLFSFSSVSPSSYAAEPNKTQTTAKIAHTSSTADSAESNVSGASQLWQDLWQTSDQQAQQHYQQKDYQQAAKQFKDSQWQGSAHYKAGEYEQALQAFKQSDSAQALYNQGNSLAQLQKVDEAIAAYKDALEKDPDLSDAKDNLAKLEELKKQQEQQKQQSQGDQENQDSQEQSDDEQQESEENQGDQQSQDGQPQDQSQDDQQQNSSENKEGEQQDEQKENQSQEAKQKEQEQKEKEKEEQAAKTKESDEEQQGEEKSLAQQAIDNKAQETEQKHQQLLNKVTDDPYLLLRNKMRLEYQKRRHEGTPQGVTKKW